MRYKNHVANRHRLEGRILTGLFSVLAIVATLSCLGLFGDSHAGIAGAALPFLAIRPMLYDTANPDGGGGGGGTMTDAEFRARVLAGVEQVKNQHAETEKNFAELDKQSKFLHDSFSKHAKDFSGLPNQIAHLERTIAQIQLKLVNERRSNHGSAIDRICGNPDMKQLVSDMIRTAVNSKGYSYPVSKDYSKASEDFRRTGLLEASGAGAGYLYTELVREIYALIAEYGIWNKFDVIPLSQNAANMIVDTTDPTMAWTAEATASSETNYAGGNVALAVGKLLGWMSVPNELLEDSVVDIGRYVLPKFANATARALDWACTSADGSADATDGGFTGIFGGGGTAAVAASGNISMATLDLEDFLAAMAAVSAAALSRQCYWWMHPTNVVKALAIKDLNGRPLFLPSTDAPSLGAIGSILGYPVILTHTAPATNAVNNKVAVFGDPMGLAVGLRSDFQFASSDQILFKEDSTVFRARARAAVKVKQATAFGVLTLAAS